MRRTCPWFFLALLALGGCSGASPAGTTEAGARERPSASTAPAAPDAHPPTVFAAGHPGTARQKAPSFTPPPESAIPDGPFGDLVRRGREIFVDTPANARAYVGNGLSCANCHLDAGRLADSAPLWGAFGMYPQYRKKNGHVNSYGERLQGCFTYSMNGKAPPLGSPELLALESYSYWMATGAPLGVALVGAGYPSQPPPARPADYRRGGKVFERNCALCHGADGQGQKVAGRYVFPPLWGPDSFNWGAGMHQLDKAAAFIKANMPLGRGGMLSDQDAWDVAMYMDGHERPQDPRFHGDLAATRKAYHDTPMSLYGTVLNGHRLGTGSAEPVR